MVEIEADEPKLEEFGVLFSESVLEQLEIMNGLKHQMQSFFRDTLNKL